MSVKTKLLAFPTAITTTAAVEIYTTPANETPIVKWLSVTNGSGAAVTMDVGYRPTAGSSAGQRYRMWKRSIAANSSEQIPLWWVGPPPGGSIFVVASVGNALTVGLDGTELEGLAD